MLTTMGLLARTLGIDIAGATATVEKEMTPPPRRIQRLTVRIHVPHTIDTENQQKLERAAHTCPVQRSVHPDVETPVTFRWG
jgi:putative redox protein